MNQIKNKATAQAVEEIMLKVSKSIKITNIAERLKQDNISLEVLESKLKESLSDHYITVANFTETIVLMPHKERIIFGHIYIKQNEEALKIPSATFYRYKPVAEQTFLELYPL